MSATVVESLSKERVCCDTGMRRDDAHGRMVDGDTSRSLPWKDVKNLQLSNNLAPILLTTRLTDHQTIVVRVKGPTKPRILNHRQRDESKQASKLY